MDFLQLVTELEAKLCDLQKTSGVGPRYIDQNICSIEQDKARVGKLFPEEMKDQVQGVMDDFVMAHSSVVVHQLVIMPYMLKSFICLSFQFSSRI